jgi:hypothetical protein
VQDVSDQLLEVIRGPHVRISTAVHRNLITDVETKLPIKDGTVTVDATAAIRRMLDLTLPPLESLYQALTAPGGEITVEQYIRFINGTRETVPLGVFVVDQEQIGYAPGDSITVKAPDRWLKVQRGKFGLNRVSVPTNTAYQEIQRLIEACWSVDFPFPGWAHLDTSAITKVGPLLWDDGDREGAINGIATDSSIEAFFDAIGEGVLQQVPTLSDLSEPVWTVDAGANGVMIGADRSRDMSRTRNAIIVSSSAADVFFAPVEVKNTTPGDPLNVTGPLGYVPYEYSSPTLRNSTQARAAGLTMLARQLGVAQQLQLESTGNPALDAEDVILVRLPQTDLNLPRPVELHMIDSVTHPLTPTGTQSILTRSTRPDTDGT